MKKVGKKKQKSKHKPHLFLLLLLVVIFALLASFLIFQKNTLLSRIASTDVSRNSLQLETFLPSPKPTKTVEKPSRILAPPAPAPTVVMCGKDNGRKMDDTCTCNHIIATCVNGLNTNIRSFGEDQPGLVIAEYCRPPFATEGDGRYCVGKPVIYLYPEKDTLVTVSVKTAGEIVVSDPQIEPGNTWQNVLAHPGGMLEYKGNTYRELFYESETTTLNAPSKGIVIKSSELTSKLKKYITLLGLTRKDEQQEFLDWWVPRLKALNSPYIFFSVLEQNEKQRLDQVTISPKPDTFIEFITYFKPLSTPENIKELVINPAPQREGFTAIEWGGVIDTK